MVFEFVDNDLSGLIDLRGSEFTKDHVRMYMYQVRGHTYDSTFHTLTDAVAVT